MSDPGAGEHDRLDEVVDDLRESLAEMEEESKRLSETERRLEEREEEERRLAEEAATETASSARP